MRSRSIPADNCTAFFHDSPGEKEIELAVHVAIIPFTEWTETRDDCRPGHSGQMRVTYRADEADHLVERVKTAFAQCVDRYWNHRFILRDWSSGARGEWLYTGPPLPPVTCGVSIVFEEPHHTRANLLRIRLLVNPEPTHIYQGEVGLTGGRSAGPDDSNEYNFRSSCVLGGNNSDQNPDGPEFDMNLAWRTEGENWDHSYNIEASDGTMVATHSNTVAHEFGHYLGLAHMCSIPNTIATDRCFSSEYCEGKTRSQIEDMMAYGDVLTSRHARPWSEQLVRHGYRPSALWLAEVLPDPGPGPGSYTPMAANTGSQPSSDTPE